MVAFQFLTIVELVRDLFYHRKNVQLSAAAVNPLSLTTVGQITKIKINAKMVVSYSGNYE